ncbi:MAG: glucuronate isomerase [Bacteroidota bacterium]
MQTEDKTTAAGVIRPFMGDDFLLENDFAAALYHDYAADMPIIDYHCHLSPADIASDRIFGNMTEIWLQGDHYKWRAMRANGISEHYITGGATDREKFEKWAETVPATLRNPLYHWTHLELRRYFGISDLLNPSAAAAIYEEGNRQLPALSVGNILKKMSVQVVCTTDDPADELVFHQAIQGKTGTQVFPTFRPDKAVLIRSASFVGYLEQLGEKAGISIQSFDTLEEALNRRMDYFETLGCRLSDHGLERMYATPFTMRGADSILRKRLSGLEPTQEEAEEYQSALLYVLGRAYARRGWTQQFHLGAQRNNNTRLLGTVGADAGTDSIGDERQAWHLSRYLDSLDKDDMLAKTIIYNLNPADNEVFATMAGNFNDGSVPGKIQWGSAWWFLDQKDGMEKQINTLSNMGLLSRFVGMLTDSRSFLSFPRHEYFRRILCNLIGRDVTRGELPEDEELLGGMVQDICYYNARNYFKFPVK